MGTYVPTWQFWRCHLEWWNNRAVANPMTILLLEGGRAATFKTPSKTSYQGTCLGSNKQERCHKSSCLWRNYGCSPILRDSTKTLLPFLQEKFPPPTTHRFMQDNDRKHCSRTAKQFYNHAGINWWCIPQSPDVNPIKNLWHELKEFIRREVKPTTKQQLVDGISTFWNTVDVRKCCQYIGHLNKVLPKIIEKSGDATGY